MWTSVNLFLADLLLIVHLCLVLFVLGGFIAIPLGAKAGWAWVRNRKLRMAHLVAIAAVAAETLLGIACPLTVWEDALRGVRTETGFIERLLHRVIFYDLPGWVFGAVYVGGAVVAAALWWLVPPRASRTKTRE